MVAPLTNGRPELDTRTPCLVLGSFCYTVLPFLGTPPVYWICKVRDTVSKRGGWLPQAHGVPGKALGLQRNPLFICQPHSVNISGAPVVRGSRDTLWRTSRCWPSSLGAWVWWFAPGQAEVILHFLLLYQRYRVYLSTVEILVKFLKLSINT